jgi:hypothetical protein
MEYIMKSTSLSFQSESENLQADTNSDDQQSNLDITQKVNILAACIKSELNRFMRELFLYSMLRDVYEDEYPNEDNPDNEEDPDDDDDSEGEEDDDDDIPELEITDDDDIPELQITDDDDILDLAITDDDGWDEDFDENGLKYWVPDEVWIPEDDIDPEEEIEPVDSKIVPIGWTIDK